MINITACGLADLHRVPVRTYPAHDAHTDAAYDMIVVVDEFSKPTDMDIVRQTSMLLVYVLSIAVTGM